MHTIWYYFYLDAWFFFLHLCNVLCIALLFSRVELCFGLSLIQPTTFFLFMFFVCCFVFVVLVSYLFYSLWACLCRVWCVSLYLSCSFIFSEQHFSYVFLPYILYFCVPSQLNYVRAHDVCVLVKFYKIVISDQNRRWAHILFILFRCCYNDDRIFFFPLLKSHFVISIFHHCSSVMFHYLFLFTYRPL